MQYPRIRGTFVAPLLVLLALAACTRTESGSTHSAGTAESPGTTNTTPPAPAATISTVDYSLTGLANLQRYAIDCGGQRIDLAGPVAEIAAAIEDSSFLYAVKPLTDCSGIFHRVLKKMKAKCPDQAYPPIDTYRDTRDLARWFHERGQLILIEDAVAAADLIKPGAVLFYGQRNKKYSNFTAEDLFQRNTGINHMGVVVRVQKDADGRVVSYELFHGHGRPGKTPASTTNYHRRVPTRASYPPFGNGTEQWVAFAPLVDLANEAVTAK